MTDIVPGWYPDPAEPETQRYWDGEQWVGAPLPAGATPPPDFVPHDPPRGTAPPPPSLEKPAPPVAAPPASPAPVSPPTAPGPLPAPGPPPVPLPGVYAVQPPSIDGQLIASPGARLVARLIDIGAVFGLNVLVNGWFVYQYVVEMSPLIDAYQRWMLKQVPTPPEPSDRLGNLQLAIVVIALALWFAYEVPALASDGRTLGKRVMGLRVLALDPMMFANPGAAGQPGFPGAPTPGGPAPGAAGNGDGADGEPERRYTSEKLGFIRAFRRWSIMALPMLLWQCCGIGFLLQAIDALSLLFSFPLRQSWHDRSARTVVVQTVRPPTRGDTQ